MQQPRHEQNIPLQLHLPNHLPQRPTYASADPFQKSIIRNTTLSADNNRWHFPSIYTRINNELTDNIHTNTNAALTFLLFSHDFLLSYFSSYCEMMFELNLVLEIWNRKSKHITPKKYIHKRKTFNPFQTRRT